MIFLNKEDQFVHCHRHIMMPLFHHLNRVILRTSHGYQHHILRQIDITACLVLFINRRDHHAVADHQLILNLIRIRIVRIIESQRAEHHLIPQRRLHVLAVQIRQQAVTDLHHSSACLAVGELIQLLLTCSKGSMISHQRREHTELHPA